jgi:hypothetical protein
MFHAIGQYIFHLFEVLIAFVILDLCLFFSNYISAWRIYYYKKIYDQFDRLPQNSILRFDGRRTIYFIRYEQDGSESAFAVRYWQGRIGWWPRRPWNAPNILVKNAKARIKNQIAWRVLAIVIVTAIAGCRLWIVWDPANLTNFSREAGIYLVFALHQIYPVYYRPTFGYLFRND